MRRAVAGFIPFTSLTDYGVYKERAATMLPSLLVALLVGAGRTLSQIQPESVYEPPADTQGTVPSNRSSGVNQQWANLMGNALYFYDVQRAGTLPNDFRVEWRNDTVPDDGKDVGLDLSGGFFDAGNFVKVRSVNMYSPCLTLLYRRPFLCAGS